MSHENLTRQRQFAANCIHLITATLILIASGCGPRQKVDPNRTTVSGSVTFDGKPLPGGVITFTLADGNIASTVFINGGRYSTNRVPIGANLVTIETESLQFGNRGAYVPIPARYADPSQSGFEVEIKPGENSDVNFELSN